MKKLTFPLLLATALVATGCSSEDHVAEIDNSQRSAIELSGTHTVSRAGFTGAETTLKLHYVSTKKSETGFDDGAGKVATLYMTSSATAAIDTKGGVNDVSAVSQTTGADGQKRYWDDVHGRNSNLSIYSIAVPNKTSITKNATAFNAWDTNVKEGSATAVANTIAWEVSAIQTLETIADEDLAYSNNVSGDNTLVYDAANKKFQKAEGTKNLEFNHALSRFTINIKKGDGFGDFSTEFKASSVKFSGFKVKGTLDVAAGTISGNTAGEVEAVGSEADYKVEGTKVGYTYVAQVFPGTTIQGVTDPMLTITVDGNVYPITGAQIYNALETNNSGIASAIEPGKNYNLTINLKKVGIDLLSATLVDWNDITAEPLEMDNSHLTFSFYNNNTPCSEVNLYKYEQGLTDIVTTNSNYSAAPQSGWGYTEVALSGTGNPYTTNEYYKDNKTAYHFRSLNNAAETALNTNKTAFTMTSGNNVDYHWGAPMLPTDLTSIPYSNAEGYKANIAKGIVAASKESNIVLTEVHMMSDIIVKLETTTGDDKVDLTNATVKITSASETGTVDMGLGLITPATTYEDMQMTKGTDNTFTLSVIPQLLSRSATAKVGLTIDTDNDRYFVDLSAIKATSVGSQVTNMQTVNDYITQWYPGHKYTYTFTLKKSGITVKATLVDWNTVSTPNTEIWM